MSAPNDGGPAFARDSHIDRQTGLVVQQNGMTLRDYFAAAAMQSLIIARPYDSSVDRAFSAYLHAESMIQERNKEEQS